jgi:protocatechuate 3,4-dioxygenase beta subunit
VAGVTITIYPGGLPERSLDDLLEGPEDEGYPTATTDDDGFFRVSPIPAMSVAVAAHGGGFVRAEREDVDVPAVGEAWVEFRLERGKTISGRVTDKRGAPIAGAVVRALGAPLRRGTAARETARSGADGSYVVQGLEEGEYWLAARADGYLDENKGDTPAGATGVDFQLAPAASIRGRVVWRGTGTPIPDAAVKALDLSSPHGRFAPETPATTTGGDGAFVIDGLGPGRYAVEADAAGAAPGRSAHVVLAEGGSASGVVVELAAGTTVSGTVLLADGRVPLAGVDVVVSRGPGLPGASWVTEEMGPPPDREESPPDGETHAVTDALGRFTLAHVDPGSRILVARHPEHPPARATVDVPESGAVSGVEIPVASSGAIAGTVVDGAGRPVSGGAAVSAAGAEGSGHAEVGGDGRYRIAGLKPGDYSLTLVLRPESNVTTTTMRSRRVDRVAVRAGETTTADFNLGHGVTVHGLVLRGGEPVPDAFVMFSPEERGAGGMTTTRSDEAGAYSVRDVAPGAYRVMVDSTPLRATVPDVRDYPLDLEVPAGVIRGVVVDDHTGEPVAEAIVNVRQASSGPAKTRAREFRTPFAGRARTGEDGSFEVLGIADGDYEAHVAHRRYETRRVSVAVRGGTPLEPLEIRLEAGIRVVGTVADAAGLPLVDALINLRSPAAAPSPYLSLASRRTDTDGRFDFPVPRPGTYWVSAVAAGFASSPEREVDVTEAGATVDFRLTPGGRIVIRVTDSTGHPAARARIGLTDAAGNSAWSRMQPWPLFDVDPDTDDLGVLRQDNVTPGTYTVRAFAPQGGFAQATIQVREGQTTTTDLRLP